MTELLTVDDVRERIRTATHTQQVAAAHERTANFRYVRPLVDAADNLIDTIQNTNGRFMLGLAEIDVMTRGFGPGELVYVTGRAHAGKTQVILTGIVNNPQAHVIIFTPDEVAELVLAKLVAIRHGINSETLEARIKNGDRDAVALVRRAAADDFKNVVVVDDGLNLDEMTVAVGEAEQLWQAPCDLAVYDFLELLPGDEGASGVSQKSKAIKRWSKQQNFPTICLHQAGKAAAPRGKAGGMDALRYGGDTEAIFVLEVYRKRDNMDGGELERQKHVNTITVSVAKNKRPPSKTGEVDFHIEPTTGAIRHLRDGDLWGGQEMPTVDVPAPSPPLAAPSARMRELGFTPRKDLA